MYHKYLKKRTENCLPLVHFGLFKSLILTHCFWPHLPHLRKWPQLLKPEAWASFLSLPPNLELKPGIWILTTVLPNYPQNLLPSLSVLLSGHMSSSRLFFHVLTNPLASTETHHSPFSTEQPDLIFLRSDSALSIRSWTPFRAFPSYSAWDPKSLHYCITESLLPLLPPSSLLSLHHNLLVSSPQDSSPHHGHWICGPLQLEHSTPSFCTANSLPFSPTQPLSLLRFSQTILPQDQASPALHQVNSII